jgi:hypothetical protein
LLPRFPTTLGKDGTVLVGRITGLLASVQLMKHKLRHAKRWLAGFLMAAVGCTSGDGSVAQEASSLKFVGMSGSDVTVVLANGLDSAIYIRGERRSDSDVIDVMSADSEIRCITLPTSPPTTPESNASMFAFIHGAAEWSYAKVQPKGNATLVIATTFPQQHRGNRCSISVRLKDETVVGPAEFDT